MVDENIPIVSVVIPTFNREYIIEKCLDALLAQTYTSYEVILVDDGSSDRTVSIINEYKEKHQEITITLIILDGNHGANVARNEGIQRARAEFVVFIDSDCIPDPDWLEKMTHTISDTNSTAVVGLVDDIAVSNQYELLFKGCCRVHGDQEARRIVSSNLIVRRSFLLAHPFEEDRKYGCNEEGLFLKMKAAGCLVRFNPAARIRHYHPYTREQFFKRAYGLGCSAAWLVYKYYLPPRLDVSLFIIAYGAGVLGFLNGVLFRVALLFFALACAALGYNEYARKGKTLRETLHIFPLLLIYYHIRLYGYISESIRLHFLPNQVERIDLSAIQNKDTHDE